MNRAEIKKVRSTWLLLGFVIRKKERKKEKGKEGKITYVLSRAISSSSRGRGFFSSSSLISWSASGAIEWKPLLSDVLSISFSCEWKALRCAEWKPICFLFLFQLLPLFFPLYLYQFKIRAMHGFKYSHKTYNFFF